MSCLDNIVTIGACGDDGDSLSGFELIQAAGISRDVLSKIADVDTHSGAALALQKKKVALLKVKNNFINVMAENSVEADISQVVYPSGGIKTALSAGIYSGNRGVVIHAANAKDKIKKVLIKSFSFYPEQSGTVVFTIINGNETTTYNVSVTAGSVNTVMLEDITADGKALTAVNGTIKIFADNSTISFKSSSITCMKGCGGRTPNSCAWADGWNGTKAVKSDGYGLVVEFYCDCDYDEVLCQLAPTLLGEIIYYAWQIEIFEEQIASSRFNNIVVYQDEALADRVRELKREYSAKWKALIQNFKPLMRRFNSSCVKCKGLKWVINI